MKLLSFAWLGQPVQKANLRYLAYFLSALVLALVVTSMLAGDMHIHLPDAIFWHILPAHVVLLAMAWIWTLRTSNPVVASYLLMLLTSVILLGWFLYASGGHTNPLISLLLLPVAISAVLLPWQATVSLSTAVLTVYGLLTQFFSPLHGGGSHGEHAFMQLHLAGMWLTFTLSVLLILALVMPMAMAMRKQAEKIAAQREQMLRDERIVAMATFAASAAHQLGTPLSTLAVLADDLQQDADAHFKNDLQTMATQIDLCKKTLHSMMRRADDIRHGVKRKENVSGFVRRLREEFSLLHPAHSLRISQPEYPDVYLNTDDTLDQAILNLLDNAVRASKDDPQLTIACENTWLYLRILDSGPGVPEAIRAQLGQPFVSGREGGTGLGLFLSHATINRFGGTLSMEHNEQGTLTEIRLPVTTS